MSYIFTEAHKQLKQLFFAINLHVSTDSIIENEIKELFRGLRTAFSKEFGKATYLYEQSTKSGTIVANQNHRQIVVSPFTLQYIERKRFNNHTFNEVCKSLYEFYVKEKQVNLQDIKLIGNIIQRNRKITRLAPSFILIASSIASGRSLLTVRLMITAGISQLITEGIKMAKNSAN